MHKISNRIIQKIALPTLLPGLPNAFCKNTGHFINSAGVKRNSLFAKFLTSHHVPMHRVIFYIPNTLIKLIIRA